MRTARTVQLVLCSATIVLSVACNKGPNFGPGLNDDENSLAAMLESNVENARQHFQVDAASGGSITGVKGVRVVFGPNAFRTASGAVVSGQVSVSLVEVMDIGDMVWLNKTTVGADEQSGGLRLLSSGGAVEVLASQGGQRLVLAEAGMQVNVPTEEVDSNMQVFTSPGMTEDVLIWNLADSTAMDTAVSQWGENWTYFYQFQTTHLNWINCDYFPYSPANTTLTAVTPDDVPNDSTLVWFVFPDFNGVSHAYGSAPHTYTFGLVPVGASATVVALTRNGSEYRSAFFPFTTTTNGSVGLSFQTTTLQAFETAVEQL